jgi:hypothetical protein
MSDHPEETKSNGLWRVLLFTPTIAWLMNPNRNARVPWQFIVSRVLITVSVAAVAIFIAGRIW